MRVATATTTVCLLGLANPIRPASAAVPETVDYKSGLPAASAAGGGAGAGAIRGAVGRAMSLLKSKTGSDPNHRLSKRDLFETHITFEECVCKTLAECEAIIEAEAANNADLFGGAKIIFDVRYKRQRTDDDYYKVVLRMDAEGDHVDGTNGDGIVEYPWDWKTLVDGVWTDVPIGPWDCDTGTPLTAAQCCTFIKASVPNADDQGNFLECYNEPKEAHDPNRVIVYIDPTTKTVVDDLIPKVA